VGSSCVLDVEESGTRCGTLPGVDVLEPLASRAPEILWTSKFSLWSLLETSD
jgi:hypothetical protein